VVPLPSLACARRGGRVGLVLFLWGRGGGVACGVLGCGASSVPSSLSAALIHGAVPLSFVPGGGVIGVCVVGVPPAGAGVGTSSRLPCFGGFGLVRSLHDTWCDPGLCLFSRLACVCLRGVIGAGVCSRLAREGFGGANPESGGSTPLVEPRSARRALARLIPGRSVVKVSGVAV